MNVYIRTSAKRATANLNLQKPAHYPTSMCQKTLTSSMILEARWRSSADDVGLCPTVESSMTVSERWRPLAASLSVDLASSSNTGIRDFTFFTCTVNYNEIIIYHMINIIQLSSPVILVSCDSTLSVN